MFFSFLFAIPNEQIALCCKQTTKEINTERKKRVEEWKTRKAAITNFNGEWWEEEKEKVSHYTMFAF
jgi:hypothetical protein